MDPECARIGPAQSRCESGSGSSSAGSLDIRPLWPKRSSAGLADVVGLYEPPSGQVMT